MYGVLFFPGLYKNCIEEYVKVGMMIALYACLVMLSPSIIQ